MHVAETMLAAVAAAK